MCRATLARFVRVLTVVVAIFSLISCRGGTGGGGADFSGSEFVADDSNAGSLTLNVNNTTIAVGGTSNFNVEVIDASGNPVPQIQVSCDSEIGVAIIEPTVGSELTDEFGNMSGVLGCELPGSFQFACRLPIGVNKRKFASIHCDGDVPVGFVGFPGAAGGGLGGGNGGVDVPDGGGSGGTDLSNIRLSAIQFFDNGTLDTASLGLDITADSDCNNDGTANDPEPFFDTFVALSILNPASVNVTFTSYNYTVNNADGAGSQFVSQNITFIGQADALTATADGGELTITGVPFAKASGGQKFYAGSSSAITAVGFKNITFRVSGRTSEGDAVTVTGRTAISIGTFDNCD